MRHFGAFFLQNKRNFLGFLVQLKLALTRKGGDQRCIVAEAEPSTSVGLLWDCVLYYTGLRSADSTLYRLPRCRTSMGERACSFSGPLAWNALPLTLRDIADRTRFRKLLKTHLFNSLP